MVSRKKLILSYTYNMSFPKFVPNFKILGSVVPEKSLTKKKKKKNVYTQTHIFTEKTKNYIPPIYRYIPLYTGCLSTDSKNK